MAATDASGQGGADASARAVNATYGKARRAAERGIAASSRSTVLVLEQLNRIAAQIGANMARTAPNKDATGGNA